MNEDTLPSLIMIAMFVASGIRCWVNWRAAEGKYWRLVARTSREIARGTAWTLVVLLVPIVAFFAWAAMMGRMSFQALGGNLFLMLFYLVGGLVILLLCGVFVAMIHSAWVFILRKLLVEPEPPARESKEKELAKEMDRMKGRFMPGSP